MPIYDEIQKSFPSPIIVSVSSLQNLAKALQSVVKHNIDAINRARDDEIALSAGREDDLERIQARATMRQENAELSWTATFADGSRKTGLKLPELLDLPNYDTKPITEIHVACGRASVDGAASGNCTLRAGTFGRGYTYSLSGSDQLVSHVSKELDHLYSQLKPKYSPITRFRMFLGFFAAITTVILLLLVMKWLGQRIDTDLASALITALIFGLWYFFAEIAIPWWWPQWECEIGDGANRSTSNRSRRTNVFYTVIVAFFIGLIILAIDHALSAPARSESSDLSPAVLATV